MMSITENPVKALAQNPTSSPMCAVFMSRKGQLQVSHVPDTLRRQSQQHRLV